MVIRTYFDRNNTMVLGSEYNTGLNPVCELFYGGNDSNVNYSRFIFQFDETRLKALYDDKTFSDLTKLTHTLRMTNTGAFDRNLLGDDTCDGKARANSFDLMVFPIPQDWDEGVGYDYATTNISSGDSQKTLGPSNWFEAKTNTPWSGGSGIFSGTTGTTIATQHFEQGNENLEIDITSVVNDYLTGATNNGLGLAFTYSYEQATPTKAQYVGFFTRHTQTFYEPHVETIYNNPIVDDRNNFYLDKNNKLYLYSTLGSTPTNLDTLPGVNVFDNDGTLLSAYTPSDVTQVTKGVYSIDINIPTTSDYIDCTQFTDVWTGITINSVSRPDVELDIIVKDSSNYFNIGDNDSLPKRIGVNVTGVRNQEKVFRDDLRKVFVSASIPYTINQKQAVDSLKYRLYVKEGRNEFTVIDFQDLNMANNYNFFLLDTLSLVPGTYYLDIKSESNQEVTTLRDVLSFDVISQSDLRISQ